MICADINNDGWIDLARNTHKRVEIYLNRGPEATPPFSLGDERQDPNQVIRSIPGGMNTEGMGWIDFDLDGDLDLLLDNHNFGIDLFENRAAQGETLPLLHATPDASPLGLPIRATNGDYLAVGDYDDDGWIDVLARKAGELDLWHNIGSLGSFDRFEPNASFDEQARNDNKGGVAFCDLDADGDLDAFWTDAGDNQIWRNEKGQFEPTGEPAASSGVELRWRRIDGVACADVDNDGDLDLFLSDGEGAGFLFRNDTTPGSDAELSFRRDNRAIQIRGDGEAVAFADVDNDGDLDLAVNVNRGSNQLWLSGANDRGLDNYLVVRALRCLPGGGFRDDVGATIGLFDPEDPSLLLTPLQEVNGGRGHAPRIPAGFTLDYLSVLRLATWCE